MKAVKAYGTCVLIAYLLAGFSAAAEPKPTLLGEYRMWDAFTFLDENGGTVCFVMSDPVQKEPNVLNRGQVYVMVTHRRKEKTSYVVSFYAGHTHKKGSNVEVQIGERKFELLTDADSAWNEDAKADLSMTKAMVKGQSMIVRGTSANEILTTDRYSLSGYTSAQRAADRKCNVDVDLKN